MYQYLSNNTGLLDRLEDVEEKLSKNNDENKLHG